ncbi:MAG TPA: DUF1800 domain-containing protein [Longimicrobiales bacterium]|nr:DUF1800 domain-containing protein [Longimicrobiales bacterium]
MNPALRALNHFGLGARVGEARRLDDPRAWLRAQLRPGSALLEGGGLPTLDEAGEAMRRVREAQTAADRPSVQAARRALQQIRQREGIAALTRRVATEAPFLERLVAFWSDHLCVSVAAKQPVIPLAGLYEREVIRPHVLGLFADMVLASARHPAMLYYLDNFQSIGPESAGARAQARRRGRERGLNENYARELLELHTLGVDGGYTQQDVIALAKILTGWTVQRQVRGGPGGEGYAFRPALHEPGPKTLLGRTYDQGGAKEGEAAIRDLCAHPATARFLARKLAGHFVADDPPESAVERLAGVYRESGGDLRVVSETLVDLDETWDPANRKLRTPQDWVVGVLRAVGAREVGPPVVQVLQALRHPLWAPAAPRGYGDLVREWADPDSLMNRAELARTMARRVGRGALDPARLEEVVDLPPDDPLRGFLADESIATDERVALAFGGPAFQWR